MTTTFFLVRHAAHDNVGGFLAGRTPGIGLGEAGRAQAARVAERLRRERFDAIHASPQQRAAETAAAIAVASGVNPVETVAGLDEIDFGKWAGKPFDVLDEDPAWRRWNAMRSLARTPAGESMLDVEARAVRAIERLHGQYPDGAVVLVSHADVIRAAVGHIIGLPIDAWSRFDVDPGSITTLIIGEWGARLLGLNEVVV